MVNDDGGDDDDDNNAGMKSPLLAMS